MHIDILCKVKVLPQAAQVSPEGGDLEGALRQTIKKEGYKTASLFPLVKTS